MSERQETSAGTGLGLLLLTFFFLSLGGLILHLRIHPVEESIYNWIPAFFGVMNTFILPVMFLIPFTARSAVVLTMVTVLVGVVGMSYHSLITWYGPVTVTTVIFRSTFPDSVILLAKVPLALAILRCIKLKERGQQEVRECVQ